ncbi:hypothetical protein CLV35_2073 [Motilibacter peucedani]|uniref:Uncharacterized protein n=1 Tax=Motilibacter peucedani TaxID=598650 RepID=A0A420XQQ9_9ACTN|nr:hypothetical protein CLV35_2073 [Motilibacter peucedani]
MVRTYRVQVTGRFDAPAPDVREQLLAEQPAHDVYASAFTPSGTFTYTPTLTRFTLRYLLDVDESSAAEADVVAELEGEVRAVDYLAGRGIPAKGLRTTTTCIEDVTAKRGRAGART